MRRLIVKFIKIIYLQNILQGWLPKRYTPSPDEPVYPASNGGYYNRNVYSDSYFAPTYTLRRGGKRDRRTAGTAAPAPGDLHIPSLPAPDIVSPVHCQPVYARVGPPCSTASMGGSPQLSSFVPHNRQVYHASTRSEPGAKLL